MPFRTWSVAEEMLAADFQQIIGNQIVATFEDDAQRTAQLPGPVTGQLSTLATHPGALYTWNGAAWVEVGRPGLSNPNLFMQSGQNVFTTTDIGEFVVNYIAQGGVNFADTPVAVFLQDMASTGTIMSNFGVIDTLNLPYGFVAQARNQFGNLIIEAPIRVGWMAIGTRAAT